MNGTQATSEDFLCWPTRLLSADDLRRHLNGQRELRLLPRTVITPLAADELNARGVRIVWQPTAMNEPQPSAWIYALDKHDAAVMSALKAVERDGIALTPKVATNRAFAEMIGRDGCTGGVLFTKDPILASCIASKIAGIRAAHIRTVAQVRSAKKSLGANLFAIETPGPTFFELRQMLRTIVTDKVECPANIATILRELDGHAHR
jgi:hypothetical protein